MKLTMLKKLLKAPFDKEAARESGMTIIEILIVIALMGVIMTLVVTNLTDSQEEAMRDAARLGMGQLDTQLQMYRVHNFRFPTQEQGLDALVAKPTSGATRWRGPYADEGKLKDPWGNKYQYDIEGKNFKITSPGPDGVFGNDDDVTYPEEAGGEGAEE